MKYYISHRGHINGVIHDQENNPFYIDAAIQAAYDVEIDIRYFGGKDWYLGHDSPEYRVTYKWLYDRRTKLWLHAKNIGAASELASFGDKFRWFGHDKDDFVAVSNGMVWVYPGRPLGKNCIACLPEQVDGWDISSCVGICSDFIERYRNGR
jgi:hypothetical protein